MDMGHPYGVRNGKMTEISRKSGVRSQIDESLRRVYQEALEQELPDTLTALLDQLRALEARGAQDGASDDDEDAEGTTRPGDRGDAGRGEARG